MTDIAIRVQNLSKKYRIGGLQARYKTLRDTLTESATAPFRRLSSVLGGRSSADGRETIWALKDISFSVERGEVVGVIGRNGAGKTTLLKILSRITDPTRGSVDLYGRVGSLLEVGTGFHPELTGRENIYLNGAILGMKRIEIDRKLDEIVDFSGIEKFIDTPMKHFSSGMQVRLAFAVAAHLEPEILLVDEVLAVGDAEFQKKCLGKMEDVAKEGRTVLFVSHNMFSVQSLCSAGMLLESGQVVMMGDISEVVDRYLGAEGEQNGEVSWASPRVAPGNDRIRLKAVRVVSEDGVAGEVDIAKEFRIQVDYWNLEADSRRLVSIHLHNSTGILLFSSSNMASVSLAPDPWHARRYPIGLFRTSCTVPGFLLNDGLHSIHLYINEKGAKDNILLVRDVLQFRIRDTGAMRKEFSGKWLGAVRPRLHWQTSQLS